MSMDEYLKKFEQKTDIIMNYKIYKPKSKHLNHIQNLLEQNDQEIKILAIGAEWCHDCAEQVPSMIKVVKRMDSNNIEMRILYGIKVNAFRKKGDILWDKRHSPPEAIDPKFDLNVIPTFYFFKNGELIGRIVEHPKFYSSLERDFCNIIME
jgi:thiol-disulfide isomerase/thioredoxin